MSPTLDLLCKKDFNVGQSEAESNTEISLVQLKSIPGRNCCPISVLLYRK